MKEERNAYGFVVNRKERMMMYLLAFATIATGQTIICDYIKADPLIPVPLVTIVTVILGLTFIVFLFGACSQLWEDINSSKRLFYPKPAPKVAEPVTPIDPVEKEKMDRMNAELGRSLMRGMLKAHERRTRLQEGKNTTLQDLHEVVDRHDVTMSRIESVLIELRNIARDRYEASRERQLAPQKSSRLYENRHIITMIVVPALNRWLKENKGYELTVPENQLILLTVHKMSENDFEEIARFVKEHPFWTAGIGRLFINMFHEKKLKGQTLNAGEILTFLTAIKRIRG